MIVETGIKIETHSTGAGIKLSAKITGNPFRLMESSVGNCALVSGDHGKG
jgi:hypothetical protein